MLVASRAKGPRGERAKKDAPGRLGEPGAPSRCQLLAKNLPVSHSSSISPLTSCDRPMPASVIVPVAGNLSLPLSLPPSRLGGRPSRSRVARSPPAFEKFADAAVEDVFVHDRLLCGAYFMWGQPKKPNPEDDEATAAPPSVMNSRRFTAQDLPCFRPASTWEPRL